MFNFHTIVYSLAVVLFLNSLAASADSAQVEALKAKIQTRDRTLLTHVEPVYPQQAFKDKLTGSVTMSFTVNLDGTISDIVILASNPTGVFEAASLAALQQWQYAAVKAPIKDVKTKFDFSP